MKFFEYNWVQCNSLNNIVRQEVVCKVWHRECKEESSDIFFLDVFIKSFNILALSDNLSVDAFYINMHAKGNLQTRR